MNDLNGLDVAEALRNRIANLQIIMITGYSIQELRQKATVDIFRILEKPFDLDQFTTAAREALTRAGIEA